MSVPVRIPDRLHQRIEALAAEERRSVANMVAVLLEQALSGPANITAAEYEKLARMPSGPTEPNTATAGEVVRAEVQADDHFRPDFGSKLGTP